MLYQYIKEVRIIRWMDCYLEGLFQIEIINVWRQEDIEIGEQIDFWNLSLWCVRNAHKVCLVYRCCFKVTCLVNSWVWLLSHISENWVVKHYANEIDISVYLLNIILWSCCYYMFFIVFGMYNLNSILIHNILFSEIFLLLPEFQLSKSTGINYNFTDHKAVNKTSIRWTV